MPWDPAEHSRLVHFWEHTKLSAAQIAEQMARTKNSILGRVDRKGLSLRGEPRIVPPPPRPTITFPPHGHCQWLDGGQFCGEPVEREDEVWCSKHRKRVYVPVNPENRRMRG